MSDELLLAIRIQKDTNNALKEVRGEIKTLAQDVKGLSRDMGDVESSGRRGSSGLNAFLGAAKAGPGILGGMATALKNIVTIAGGFVVGQGIMRLFGVFSQGVAGATNLEESLSKVKVVFGESATEIDKWSRTAAKAFGQSRAEALAAVGSFGNFFNTLGLGQVQAGEMSKTFVQLAGDLASFHNANPSDVVYALGAAMRGESEPMSRYGVLMNEATLKAKALELGLIQTTTGALSPQIKAMASYALILEQTSIAQGDFGRTAGGNANQMRILQAQFADIRNELGAALLPILIKVGRVLVDNMPMAMAATQAGIERVRPLVLALIRWFRDEIPPATIKTLNAFATFAGGVATGITGVNRGFVLMAQVISATMVGILRIVATVGRSIYGALQWLNPFAAHSLPLVDQVVEGVEIIKTEYQSLNEIKLDRVTNSIRDLESAMQGATDSIANGELLEQFDALIRTGGIEAVDAFKSASESIVDLKNDYADLGDELAVGINALEQYGFALDIEKGKLEDLKDMISLTKGVFDDFRNTPLLEEKLFDDQLKPISREIKEIELAIVRLKQKGPLSTKVQVRSRNKQTGELTGGFNEETRLTESGKAVEKLEAQLDSLRLTAQSINLEKDLAVDPLKDRLAALTETAPLPFTAIYTGMINAKEGLRLLTTELGKQETVVRNMQTEHDEMALAVEGVRLAYEELGDTIKNQEDILSTYLDTALKVVAAEDARAAAAAAAATSAGGAGVGVGGAGGSGGGGGGGAIGGLPDVGALLEGIDISGIVPDLEKVAGAVSAIDDEFAELNSVGEHSTTFLQDLQESFDNISESMNELKTSVQPISQFFDSMKELKGYAVGAALGFGLIVTAMVGLKLAIVAVEVALVGYKVAVGLAAVAQWALNLAMTANPIGLIVIAIAAVVAAIILLIVYWDQIVEKFPVLGTIAEEVQKALKFLSDWVVDDFLPVVISIYETIAKIVGDVIDYVRDNWPKIQEIIEPALKVLGGLVDFWFGAIRIFIETTMGVIQGVIDIGMGLITGDWDRAWGGLKTTVNTIWKGIEEIISLGISFLKDDLVPLMLSAGTALGEALKDGIIDGFKGTVGALGDLTERLWVAMKSIINSGISQLNKAIPDEIKIAVKFGPDIVIPLPNNPIPELASGAVVTSPTLALIGEKWPEAVIPLQQYQNLLRSGGGQTDFPGRRQSPMSTGAAIKFGRGRDVGGDMRIDNITLHLPNVRSSNPRELAHELAPHLIEELRRVEERKLKR